MRYKYKYGQCQEGDKELKQTIVSSDRLGYPKDTEYENKPVLDLYLLNAAQWKNNVLKNILCGFW